MPIVVVIATDQQGRVVSVTEQSISAAQKAISDQTIPPSPVILPGVGLPPPNVLAIQNYALAKIADSPLLTDQEKEQGAQLVRNHLIQGPPFFVEVEVVPAVVMDAPIVPPPIVQRLVDP